MTTDEGHAEDRFEPIRSLRAADHLHDVMEDDDWLTFMRSSVVAATESLSPHYLRQWRHVVYNQYLAALDAFGGWGDTDPDVPPDWFDAAVDRVLARALRRDHSRDSLVNWC